MSLEKEALRTFPELKQIRDKANSLGLSIAPLLLIRQFCAHGQAPVAYSMLVDWVAPLEMEDQVLIIGMFIDSVYQTGFRHGKKSALESMGSVSSN